MTGIFVAWSDKPQSPGWIEDGTGCHIWLGARNNRGYGRAWSGERLGLVHRIRYEREIGPISEGMVLDHYVCNRGRDGCCNPRHCRPVTHRENLLRGHTLTAANAGKDFCKRGHPLAGDNLDTNGLSRGYRWCRTCRNARRRKDGSPPRPRPETLSSPFRGVTLHRQTGRWQVTIRAGGRSHYVGLFDDEASAARAYDTAAIQLHGDRAILNNPDLARVA